MPADHWLQRILDGAGCDNHSAEPGAFCDAVSEMVCASRIQAACPDAMVVTSVGRCPACDGFPTAWDSMGVDCSECGVELFCYEDVDDWGSSHWTFDLANQEDIDRVKAERAEAADTGRRP